MTTERKRLSVIFTRPLLPSEDETTARRALASLGGAADEVVTIDIFNHFPMRREDADVEGAMVTVLSHQAETPGHDALFMRDASTTFQGVLPGPFSDASLPRYLSTLANVTCHRTCGDYVLLLDPSEVCLDPTNVVRTLDYLDASPQIDAVSVEVKIYDGDEHVRTVMRPKILRLGKAWFAGVLADDFEPKTDVNHLMAASGLTFRDVGGATAERSLFELKLLLARYYKNPQEAPAAIVTDAARRLVDHSPSGAVVILGNLLARIQGNRSNMALPLRLLGRARMKSPSYSIASAMEAYDESLSVEASAEGYLWRGLDAVDDKSSGRSWLSDLSRAVELGEAFGFRGLDLREVRRAQAILGSYEAPKVELVGNVLTQLAKVGES